jgi:hypothetical protein
MFLVPYSTFVKNWMQTTMAILLPRLGLRRLLLIRKLERDPSHPSHPSFFPQLHHLPLLHPQFPQPRTLHWIGSPQPVLLLLPRFQ